MGSWQKLGMKIKKPPKRRFVCMARPEGLFAPSCAGRSPLKGAAHSLRSLRVVSADKTGLGSNRGSHLVLRAPHTKKPPKRRFVCMARPEGFEPPTTWFVARYSIQLSYGRKIKARILVLLAGSVNSRQGLCRGPSTSASRRNAALASTTRTLSIDRAGDSLSPPTARRPFCPAQNHGQFTGFRVPTSSHRPAPPRQSLSPAGSG